MSLVTVEITQTSQRALMVKLDRAERGVTQGLREGINAAIIDLASYIKRDLLSGQLVNNVTGNLRRAIFHQMESDSAGVVGVGAEAPYAGFVNYGTRPHEIAAKNGRALAIPNLAAYKVGLGLRQSFARHFGVGVGSRAAFGFAYQQSSGSGFGGLEKVAFFRRVMHPGTKPTMFMETGLRDNKDVIQSIIADRIDRAVKRAWRG